jgi:flagellar motor switch protein FliG
MGHGIAQVAATAGYDVTVREVDDATLQKGLGKIDKQLARALENEMFKFEHLYELDTQMMGQLLREIENEVLIDALKGIEEDHREHFFAAMSSRAADGLRDEIETRGRIKRADVETAQKQFVAVAKRLAAEGAIVIGSGGDEEYV